MSTPPHPDRVAGHRILRKLGEGGSGAVYLAAPEGDPERRVALKILRPGTAFSDQERRRFQREGEIGFGLDHPNILPARAVGVLDGSWVMTFEAIEGYTLAEVVAAGFRAPEEAGAQVWTLAERAALLADVADALSHAHGKGVVHRDVKPRNVMIRRADRHPFLIDFGLARDLRADSSLTRSGAVFGTPAYMAPEQLDGDVRRVGPASDVYALGVMIHELVAGEPPFRHASFEAQRRAVANDEPPRLRTLVPDTPPELETLVLHALEKRPELRPRAGPIRDGLRRLAGGPVAGAGASERAGSSRVVHVRRAARRVGRARFKLVAGVALLLAAAAAALLSVTRRQATELDRLELRALYDQAGIDLANGELAAALVPLREAAARRPDDPTGPLEMAAAYESFGAHDEMRDALTAARARGFDPAAVDRGSARGLHHLGLARMTEQRWDEAAAAFRAALALDAGPGAPHLALFRCLRKLRREDEAVEVLRAYRDTLARRSDAYPFIEAQLHELEGSLRRALQAVRAIEPAALDAPNRLRRERAVGRLLIKLERYAEAVDVLSALVARDPDDGAAWLQRGVAQLKLDRVAPALADARRGGRLAPHDPGRHVLLVGIAWIVRGHEEDAEARRVFAEAEIDEDVDALFDAQTAYEEARELANAGEIAAARAALERALAADPMHAPALTLRANEDWYAGRTRAAFEGFCAARASYREIHGVQSGIASWRRLQNTSFRDLRVAIHVGRFAVGAELGEDAAATDSSRLVARLLAQGEDVDAALLLNFAEALAHRASSDEGDCRLARRIVSAPGFREDLGGGAAVEAVLAEIARRCP